MNLASIKCFISYLFG